MLSALSKITIFNSNVLSNAKYFHFSNPLREKKILLSKTFFCTSGNPFQKMSHHHTRPNRSSYHGNNFERGQSFDRRRSFDKRGGSYDRSRHYPPKKENLNLSLEEIFGRKNDKEFPLAETTDLPEKLQETLKKTGITSLFEVQKKVWHPFINNYDVVVRSKTGSGKTLSFLLPLFSVIQDKPHDYTSKSPRVLILEPTRELAKQVFEVALKINLNRKRICLIHGGVSYDLQKSQVRQGIDILIGTPGRIIDLIDNKSLNLSQVEYVVLDEGDFMLELGFKESVDTIFSKIEKSYQSYVFSATMPPWIKGVCEKYLRNVYLIDNTSAEDEIVPSTITHYAYILNDDSIEEKANVIAEIVEKNEYKRTIVFSRTKSSVESLFTQQKLKGKCCKIHGDLPQEKRERDLKDFKAGRYSILLATNVAARGLDIPNVDAVIQLELPDDEKSLIHRAGRTGRANKEGTNYLLVTPKEREDLLNIAKRYEFEVNFLNRQEPIEIERSLAYKTNQDPETLLKSFLTEVELANEDNQNNKNSSDLEKLRYHIKNHLNKKSENVKSEIYDKIIDYTINSIFSRENKSQNVILYSFFTGIPNHLTLQLEPKSDDITLNKNILMKNLRDIRYYCEKDGQVYIDINIRNYQEVIDALKDIAIVNIKAT